MPRAVLSAGALACVLLASFLLSGCWDRREVDKLAIVLATGLDLTPEGDLLVTAQVVRPSEVKASGGGVMGGSPRAVVVAASRGRTVAEAIRGMSQVIGRRPFWGQNRVLVVSEELARAGLAEILDWFFREREPRPRTHLVVFRGRAADVLAAENELETIPGLALDSLLALGSATSFTYPVTAHHFLRDLVAPGKDPIASAVVLVSRAGQAGFPGEEPAREGEPPATEAEKEPRRLAVGGLALFKDDRLVGWTTPEQARAVLWMCCKDGRSMLVIPGTAESARPATVEVLGAKPKARFNERDGRLHLRVELECDCALADQPRGPDIVDKTVIRDIEGKVEERLRTEMLEALGVARSLGVDPFGFGLTLHARYPKLWKRFGEDWPRALWEGDIRVSVKARVIRSGLSLRAPQ
ncbi:MAG: Ger(x)C family spore germination protein [Firmicutes bacterium]|nr:Ger(x)C family spore germination protein [Bacillota bacterium]